MDLEVDQRIARYWERQVTPEKAMLSAMEGKTIRSVANFRDGFYAGCDSRGLEIERLNSALDWLKTESKMLGDLLATIHRDGGDYVRGHGIVQACADAQQIASDHAAEMDATSAEIARLTEQCNKLLSRPAYAAGYGAGIAFGLQWAAAQIEARARVVGEQPWHGAIASELFAMAERIRSEQ